MSSTESELDRQLSLNEITFSTSLLQGPTDGIIKLIQCDNCQNLLINIYSCTECSKSYCGKCFTSFSFCKFCGCGEALKHSGLNFVLRQDFKIKCPSESECVTLCQITSLEEHINECDFIELSKCPGCGYKDIKPQVERHLKQCEDVFVECEYCHNKYKRNEMENHLVDCDFRPITCQCCEESFAFANFQYHSSSECLKKVKGKIENNFRAQLCELNETVNARFEAINTKLETINTSLEMLKRQSTSLNESIELLRRKRRLRAGNRKSRVVQNIINLVIPDQRKIINDPGNEIYCLLKLVSNNNILLASAGADFVLRIWDVLGSTCFIHDDEHDKCINSIIQVTNDDNSDIILLTCGDDGKIIKWNIGIGVELKSKELINQGSEEIYTLAELSNNYIAWAGADKFVHIKDFSSRFSDYYRLKDHTDIIYSIIVIKIEEYELIASGSKDKTIKIWNRFRGNKPLNTLTGHENTVFNLSIIEDRQSPILMSSSFDKTIRLWDIKGGDCIKVFTGHKNFVYSSIYLPHFKLILSCSSDKTVKIWNRGNGNCLQTLEADTELKCLTAFENSDGYYILAAGFEKIYAWTSHCVEIDNLNYNINFID
jgi:WD40 repeat protein